MSYTNILTEVKEHGFWITINRADKLNALNILTLQEIKAAVNEAGSNPAIQVIFLTGSGQKAFAAGADIAEFAEFNIEEGTKMSADGHAVMDSIENSPKPVIALVNGFALGGGCELAMACHLRIASDNARFGQPEINLALIPGYAGTQRLCQLIGKGRALELLLSGEAIKAEEALKIGLVNQVVTIDQLHQAGEIMAAKITSKSPLAVAKVLACVNDHYASERNGFLTEINAFGACFGTSDLKEGTQAFLQKRTPVFTGH
ncbi:MAG TPA: enoyl-CoA hydratase [Bacteroidetes bacterium]|nr:enoyl-CoA hydratase [Bacteroidota bacterium]